MARAITGLSGELRLRERHHRQVVAAMSEEERDVLIIERIRGMPRPRRDGIRRLLDEIDADESMLS